VKIKGVEPPGARFIPSVLEKFMRFIVEALVTPHEEVAPELV
jgi:hypothetical protein